MTEDLFRGRSSLCLKTDFLISFRDSTKTQFKGVKMNNKGQMR